MLGDKTVQALFQDCLLHLLFFFIVGKWSVKMILFYVLILCTAKFEVYMVMYNEVHQWKYVCTQKR